MTTLLSWMQLSLYFLVPLAATSVIGFLCYISVHWLEDVFPELFVYLEIILVFLAVCSLFAGLPFSLIPLGVLAFICGAGTIAERAIIPTNQSWGEGFMRMTFTTACCVVLSVVVLLVLDFIGLRFMRSGTATWFGFGTALGAICSPSVIPVFIWLWRSSQMRPGVDRHFQSEENAETP
ncbi:hypothetical protein IAD21_00974 [Abditibacteriota bacterium]|nr:hypothetical protein IAD21_00974 [Abditibacteriota bacterium]